MINLEDKIQAYLNGQLSNEESGELQNWIALSEENSRQFEEYKKVYELSEMRTDAFCPNVDKAWDCVERRIGKGTKVFKIHPNVYRIAAILVLAVGLGFFYNSYFAPSKLIIAKTGRGELQNVKLSDGSFVMLNENTTLKFPREFAEGKSRKVYLNGQAFFDVARDESRAFRIVGKSSVTEVLGTSFDLIAQKDYSQVNVLSGKVAFKESNGTQQVTLTKNQRAELVNSKMEVSERLNTKQLAWRFGELEFKSAPLREVAKTLAKHYQVKIKMDEGIENCLITTKFENKSMEEILEILKLIANVESETNEKGVIFLTGPSC